MTKNALRPLTRAALAVASLAALTAGVQAQTCDEGCTPGYWKEHPERWDGLDGDDFTMTILGSFSFNDSFGVTQADSGLADTVTLLDATALMGGGLDALARHAAAALASADSVCYPISVGDVVDLYRAAVLGGGNVEPTALLLASYNELGCPLSNSTPPPPPTIYCVANEMDCGCGADTLFAGCANSTGLGARMDVAGTSSVTADDLVLICTQLPPNAATLFLMADQQRRAPFLDGLLCIGGPMSKIYRIPPIFNSGAEGRAELSGGLVALSNTPLVPIPGGILAGDTWHFQTFYRDMNGCGNGANTSSAISVMFTL